MAFEITLPRLGWSMEQGTFLGWLKKPGERVKPGDVLFELEGEKATQEVEAVDAGILALPPTAPAPGAVLAVGAVLGYLLADGEAPPWENGTPTASKPVAAPQAAAAPPAAAPSVRRLARELGVDLGSVQTTSPDGRLTAADVHAAARSAVTTTVASAAPVATSQRVRATPRARRVASELGVDVRQLHGSGRNGRIRAADVEQAAERGVVVQTRPATASTAPISSRRRTIADRMLASVRQTAPVTLTTRADATHLVGLRQQFKAAGQAIVPAFTDIIAKLAALALAQHPDVAARWEQDQIVSPERLDIGIAVDTDAGLLVPVLRDVPALSLPELSRQSRELIERARTGKLSVAEMQGGVFTITNLGSYGIDAFTPIINAPETAILGLGAIRREAVVLDDDRIVPRDQMTLSLTFDHRVVDGAPAARFLATLRGMIENPSAWLLA
jgi:pyruvate dehydrogenase E2 component (dihydrolipoamide acetyltransferase)